MDNNTKLCDWCNKPILGNESYKFNLCSDCEDNCVDHTGYCSLSCCMGEGCDDSC